jgi:hypothetical protein
LFIDDEQALVDLNKQMLEAIGYKVVAKMDPIDKKPIKKGIFAETVRAVLKKTKKGGDYHAGNRKMAFTAKNRICRRGRANCQIRRSNSLWGIRSIPDFIGQGSGQAFG